MLQYAQKQSSVVSLLVQETGTYESQFKRPYQTNLNGDVYEKIIRSIEVNPSHKLAPNAIADYANEFIHPQSNPDGGEIFIPNGWQTRRLRFLLHIRTINYASQAIDQYIIGFTDVPGYSLSGHLDPSMTFIINGVYTTVSVKMNTPTGYTGYNRLTDASHLLSNDGYEGVISDNQIYGLRPEDVYNNMHKNTLRDYTLDQNDIVLDTRGILSHATIKSRRDNAIAPVYTSNLINNYVQSIELADRDISERNHEDPDAHYNTALEYAITSVQAPDISQDPFLSFIRARSGTMVCNRFTLIDLQAFDPNYINVTQFVSRSSSNYVDDLHIAGSGSSWTGSNVQTVFATTLSQSIPGYMLNYGFLKISFISTNYTNGSNIETSFSFVRSFNNHLNNEKEIESLTFRINNEILKALSYGGLISFSVEGTIDLMGETKLQISINGEPVELFVCPSFSDSLMAPVFTNNVNTVNHIAQDFSNIVESVRNLSPIQPYSQDMGFTDLTNTIKNTNHSGFFDPNNYNPAL